MFRLLLPLLLLAASATTVDAAGECASIPCRNGGTCFEIASPASFTCICVNGFYGPTCGSTLTTACASGPCQNGGVCMNTLNSFYCMCPSYYTGALCHEIGNPCLLQRGQYLIRQSSTAIVRSQYDFANVYNAGASAYRPPAAILSPNNPITRIESYSSLGIHLHGFLQFTGSPFRHVFTMDMYRNTINSTLLSWNPLNGLCNGTMADATIRRSDGLLFALQASGTSPRYCLIKANPANGDYQIVGVTNIPVRGPGIAVTPGLSFDDTGKLFAVQWDNTHANDWSFWELDPATGQNTTARPLTGYIRVPLDASPAYTGGMTLLDPSDLYIVYSYLGSAYVLPIDQDTAEMSVFSNYYGRFVFGFAPSDNSPILSPPVLAAPVGECPCSSFSVCTQDAPGSAAVTCACALGFTGADCGNVVASGCTSAPCMNGGLCEDDSIQFSCDCPDGFMGARCEIVVDTCTNSKSIYALGSDQSFQEGGYFQTYSPWIFESNFTKQVQPPAIFTSSPKPAVNQYIVPGPGVDITLTQATFAFGSAWFFGPAMPLVFTPVGSAISGIIYTFNPAISQYQNNEFVSLYIPPVKPTRLAHDGWCGGFQAFCIRESDSRVFMIGLFGSASTCLAYSGIDAASTDLGGRGFIGATGISLHASISLAIDPASQQIWYLDSQSFPSSQLYLLDSTTAATLRTVEVPMPALDSSSFFAIMALQSVSASGRFAVLYILNNDDPDILTKQAYPSILNVTSGNLTVGSLIVPRLEIQIGDWYSYLYPRDVSAPAGCSLINPGTPTLTNTSGFLLTTSQAGPIQLNRNWFGLVNYDTGANSLTNQISEIDGAALVTVAYHNGSYYINAPSTNDFDCPKCLTRYNASTFLQPVPVIVEELSIIGPCGGASFRAFSLADNGTGYGLTTTPRCAVTFNLSSLLVETEFQIMDFNPAQINAIQFWRNDLYMIIDQSQVPSSAGFNDISSALYKLHRVNETALTKSLIGVIANYGCRGPSSFTPFGHHAVYVCNYFGIEGKAIMADLNMQTGALTNVKNLYRAGYWFTSMVFPNAVTVEPIESSSSSSSTGSAAPSSSSSTADESSSSTADNSTSSSSSSSTGAPEPSDANVGLTTGEIIAIAIGAVVVLLAVILGVGFGTGAFASTATAYAVAPSVETIVATRGKGYANRTYYSDEDEQYSDM